MRIRSQPLIFALVAICQSFFTASYNIDFNNPCWVARDDHVDYDPCDLYDMSNDELADICESIGYQHRPNPSRNILIIGAKLCLVIDIDQMNASDDDWQREATREAMFGMIDQSIHYDQGHNNKDRELCKNSDSCIEDDVQRLILEYHMMLRDPSFISRTKRDRISYLFHKDGINDQGTHMMYRYMFNLRLKEYEDEMDMKWCEKVEDLDNTLCRFEDLKDSVLIDICEGIGYHHKPNTTRDQIVRIARDYCFPYITIQENIDNENTKLSMLTDLLGDLPDAQNHVLTVVCNTAEDINHPICTYDDLKDDVLIGICKKVGYDHNPNPTRAQLVLAAAMCFAGNQVSLDDKAKVLLLDIVHETVERNSLVQFLYKSYLDMMKDASFIGMSRNDRITYILSYHGIDDMQEKANMWKLLPEKLEEEELYLTLGIDTKVKEQWIERYIPTPKEIAKLPDWYSYKPVTKGGAIKIMIFQKDGKVVISQWSKESQTWSSPRAISESNHYNNRLFVDLMKTSMQYEHVLLFRAPILSKQTLVIGFNYGDDPLDTAMRVLDEYKLRGDKWSEKEMINAYGGDERTSDLHLMSIAEFVRKYVSETHKHKEAKDKVMVSMVRLEGEEVDGYKFLTPEDIAKLPDWDSSHELSGIGEEIKIFQKDGIAVTSEWSAKSRRWSQPEHLAESYSYYDLNDEASLLIYDLITKSIMYDHVFPFSIGDDENERKKVIGYNDGDDPLIAAQRVIDEYKLDETDMYLLGISEFVRRKVSKIPTPQKGVENKLAPFVLVFILLGMYLLYLMLMPQRKKRKRAMKLDPKKSPLSCHQPVMKKTIYVKSLAIKRLNQGKRLNGIVTRSRARDIQIERKTGQPTVMYKIKASNGEVYVPINMKGSEEAIEKAVVLIKEAVGKENVDEEIELPPTNPKQATAVPPVTSSAPIRIPSKKKKESRFTSHVWASICTNWQSLKEIIINTCQNATSRIRNLFNYQVSWALQFLSLCCVILYEKVGDPCTGGSGRDDNCVKLVDPLKFTLFSSLLINLPWYRLRSIPGFISRTLRMPFEMYQAKKIKQTIYVKSSNSKNLSGKKGSKKNEIIQKSGVDDMQMDKSAVGDNYILIHMAGSRKSVQEAIELIQKAVGKDHVSITKPSNIVSVQESASSTVNSSEPQPNQEDPSTPESPVQPETMSDNGNNLNKEATAAIESPPAEPQEEKTSEIGIDTSQQGMTTRETITEASMSSLNDRSNVSNAYSNFTLNEDDPLLIFLRSQASCIKGSVDEFYTWLVKSEDIDSMMALKEAVNEDDYLNDMKVGDGGGSGVKGFKRKAFLRAISEYFNDKSDTKSTAEAHQSSPQCQKKNPSDTLEPPEELVCPISLNLMTNDPVVAADGITYERSSIEDWFEKSEVKIRSAEENLKQNPQSEADQRVVNNGICSPVHGSKMENLTLVPHIGTRNMARAFEEKKDAGS